MMVRWSPTEDFVWETSNTAEESRLVCGDKIGGLMVYIYAY